MIGRQHCETCQPSRRGAQATRDVLPREAFAPSVFVFSNYHSIKEALGNCRQRRLKTISARWHKYMGGSEGNRVQTPAGVGGARAAGPHLRPRPPQRAGRRPHLMVQAKRWHCQGGVPDEDRITRMAGTRIVQVKGNRESRWSAPATWLSSSFLNKSGFLATQLNSSNRVFLLWWFGGRRPLLAAGRIKSHASGNEFPPPAGFKRQRSKRRQFSAGVLRRSSGGKQMRNHYLGRSVEGAVSFEAFISLTFGRKLRARL